MKRIKDEIKKIPKTPGVYIFQNKEGDAIYIGKAANLQRRVQSYFIGKDKKSRGIIGDTKSINYETKETVIEALIREAELIKEKKPFYNIKENDDRSFLHVVITKEDYPRVILRRGKKLEEEEKKSVFGPFVYSAEIREALKIIRKIFPYSTHTKKEIKKGVACFHYQIGLCPGTCVGKVSKKDYIKNIENIELFFKGGKKKIILELERQMREKSEKLEYEKAKDIKRKIDALSYIQETALIGKKKEEVSSIRVEGYDVSNIAGNFSVGSMVVFKGSFPQKEQYRLFKIKEVTRSDDTKMIREIIQRRLQKSWPLPSLMVIDGGKGQVSTTKEALNEKGFDIPVVGVGRRGRGRKEKITGDIKGFERDVLLRVQHEAHRFALSYHKKIRKKHFL